MGIDGKEKTRTNQPQKSIPACPNTRTHTRTNKLFSDVMQPQQEREKSGIQPLFRAREPRQERTWKLEAIQSTSSTDFSPNLDGWAAPVLVSLKGEQIQQQKTATHDVFCSTTKGKLAFDLRVLCTVRFYRTKFEGTEFVLLLCADGTLKWSTWECRWHVLGVDRPQDATLLTRDSRFHFVIPQKPITC